MARTRRPFGGMLGGTFETLLHTTLSQVEHLKDSAARAAKSQREQLTAQLIERKKTAKLAALGARVLARPEASNLAAADPEIAALIDEIEVLDEKLAERAEVHAPPAKAEAPAEQADTKRRQAPRVWRPVIDDDEDLERYMVDGDVPDK